MRFQFKAGLLATAALCALGTVPAAAQDVSACLITKTDTNPFFVKMREGAAAKAEELGIALNSYAGQVDGDNESQVAAIEACIANGASGILITASDTAAIVPAVEQARDAGLLVIALDTPLEPIEAAECHLRHRQLRRRRADRPVGRGDPGRRGGQCADRHARSRDQPADGRRAARPGLPDGLRHRHRGHQPLGRRDRRADRLQRGDLRQRGGRPDRDGELSRGQSRDQRRLHHQRAGRRRGLRGARRDRARERRDDRVGRWRLPGRAERGRRRDRRHEPAISAADGLARHRGDRAVRRGRRRCRPTPKARTSSTPASSLVTGAPVDGVESISVEEGLERCWG